MALGTGFSGVFHYPCQPSGRFETSGCGLDQRVRKHRKKDSPRDQAYEGDKK